MGLCVFRCMYNSYNPYMHINILAYGIAMGKGASFFSPKPMNYYARVSGSVTCGVRNATASTFIRKHYFK